MPCNGTDYTIHSVNFDKLGAPLAPVFYFFLTVRK